MKNDALVYIYLIGALEFTTNQKPSGYITI